MSIINAQGTTTVLLGLLAMLSTVIALVLWLDRRFNPPAGPRDPADTNPWGIATVADLMTLGEIADRATRDRMANKPRIGELPVPDMELPPPLLGTIPPVRRPSIPSAWRASGDAARRADKRWLSGDADEAVRELARGFREREDRR